MNENDITRKSKQAIEQMREMNKRANFQHSNNNSTPKNKSDTENNPAKSNSSADFKNTPPTVQNFTKKDFNRNKKTADSFFDGMGLSLSNLLPSDADTTLIIGLLLILMNEKTDKILLFALIYILI